eukprot:TRINITY_DN4528_c0_g1_i1.p1 TRINITY_DN4528_c0_g1~~TRINITY_DN4528_c0_g1_i1.p1  ORF type:complete len:146 (+),score=25.49 TRINITY_DN4528_c0_g1_i1:115-552(+)
MPCWTEEELMSIVKYIPNLDQETVKTRFAKYGGIPRYVLNETDDWDVSINDAIASSNLDDLQSCAGGPENMPDASHMILQYDANPSSGYRSLTVRFASNYVAEKVSARLLLRVTEIKEQNTTTETTTTTTTTTTSSSSRFFKILC